MPNQQGCALTGGRLVASLCGRSDPGLGPPVSCCRQTLWKRVQGAVTPLLASVISVIDRDGNLELLAAPDVPSWTRDLWMFIFSDLKLLNVPLAANASRCSADFLSVLRGQPRPSAPSRASDDARADSRVTLKFSKPRPAPRLSLPAEAASHSCSAGVLPGPLSTGGPPGHSPGPLLHHAGSASFPKGSCWDFRGFDSGVRG